MQKYTPDIDEKFMEIALKEARKALSYGDVPIGAVVTLNNMLISKAHNQVERKKNSLMHAEMIAIEKAISKISYKHLIDCNIYITLEPCSMCAGSIILSRIKKVVFGASDPKAGAAGSIYNILNDSRLNHRCEIVSGVLMKDSSSLLSGFFKELRSKKTKC